MEMFSHFKRLGASLNLKDIIDGSGLTGLLSTTPVSSRPTFLQSLDLPATEALAARAEWEAIRAHNEENFKKAAMADEQVWRILKACEEHFETCQQLQSEARQLPKVKAMIEETTDMAVRLKDRLRELDTMINKCVSDEERNKKVERAQSEFEAQMESYKKRMGTSWSFNGLSAGSREEDKLTSLESIDLFTQEDQDALENFLGPGSDDEANETVAAPNVQDDRRTSRLERVVSTEDCDFSKGS
ncbi:3199_t:CDS:2 [Paraglomus brasilianum]|uniref:3199_t:CDS:1 n=1 Tax=Paraglomus brasilianum TaxID=144538 RepID=A0A9N8WS13_9GLOM|nr:3199_t:CDS:2 [Paraglomus brasilianum]